MARMYARKKGKSSSHKPYVTTPPEWIPLTPEEVEKRIIELGKKGWSTSKIGIYLRDQYTIPSVKLVTGKKISKVLEDNGIKMDIPEDLMFLMKKAVNISHHMDENHKDIHNKRAMNLTEAKIRRLVKYYKSSSRLPADWTYTLAKAKLLVE